MKILVTGCAGFIGSHFCLKLKKKNVFIVGVDSINNYYSKKLKKKRISLIKKNLKNKFKFYPLNIENKSKIEFIFKKYKFDYVVNLAAQAGVRYSITNPTQYIKSNINGFYNILESCRKFRIKHLLFASSSSVYGNSRKFPLKEMESEKKPIQLYAATKISNEVMAYSYSHLYKIKTTGIRYFTVYGEWGRPDMLLFKLVKKILTNKSIEIFNFGKHERDFTYIDDAINGTIKALFNKNFKFYDKYVPFRVFNIGYGKPIKLMDFIAIVENKLGLKAKIKFIEKQKGDVEKTFSDINLAKKYLNFKPTTNHKKGIKKFIDWYLLNAKKI